MGRNSKGTWKQLYGLHSTKAYLNVKRKTLINRNKAKVSLVYTDKYYMSNKRREIIINADHALIPLTQGMLTKISLDSLPLVEGYSWYAQYKPNTGTFYARSWDGATVLRLHRVVMGLLAGDKRLVDHINHDTLDNTLENLRICSSADNLKNQRKAKDNTSGHKGVNFDKRASKWRAQIMLNGKRKTLGYFSTIEDAAKAYDKAAIEHYGEYAFLNSP